MKDETAYKIDFEEEITARSNFSINLRELWHYRELIFIFTWRDIKVKYKQTTLGILWAVIQPIAIALIFTLTVGKILPQSYQTDIPYPIFVYSGLIHWYLFSSGLQNSSNSMLANENIIKKIYFPRLVIPISNIFVSCFDFLITFAVYIVILLFYDTELQWRYFFLWMPLAIVLNIITILGIGTFLSALTIKYRDFRYTIPFLIQFFMFASPIFYPAHIVSNKILAFAIQLNPFNATLELTRGVFANTAIDWQAVCLGTGTSILCFCTGLIYFRKTEAYFADLA